jgi:hypothetical protein
MSAFHATVLHWANERLDALLGAPPMWGSNEAVEMQALLLLELRSLALRPEESSASPDAVFALYTTFLRQRFPERAPAPLCEIEGAPFAEILAEFRRLLDHRLLAEDPFQHADLVIRLAYKPESRPSAQSFTGACDDVRRAIRAFARGADKKTGRVRKEVEALTDFSLRDVRVTQPNGAPADAWLLLERGASTQTGQLAIDEVRAALSSLASTATWLESGDDVSALPIDDNDARVRAAVQTMRLLPRRDVALVEIGGVLAGAPKPFVLRASHQGRCVSILAAQSAPRPFDETDEIRGIDLDRGIVTLGKRRRLTCYVPSGLLGTEVREVGVRSRVRGHLYAPPLSPPFVMAESIELDEPEARRGTTAKG